jgi:glutaredoxin 3
MRVDIYTTPTCGYCHQVKRFFTERGVRYFEYDVSRDQDAAERMMNLTGQMGVPVIVIDGQVVVGFDRMRIESLLTGSGSGRRPRLGLKVADASRYTSHQGAYVGAVEPDSSGVLVGLQQGDVIVSVNSNRIDNATDLAKALSAPDVSGRVTIVFIRDEQAMQTQVVM